MAEKESEAVEQAVQAKKAPAAALTPFEEMDRVMHRLSEDFLPRGWLRRMRWEWPEWREMPVLRMPHVDVVDRDEDVMVRAEVPGMDKKDLDISVTENTVTIKGARKEEKNEEKGEYYRREISESSFSRTVALPADVDGSRAKASCSDGVLELVMPKLKKSTRHTVKVA
jgi:HSP20 family protein